uniref:Tubulin tyrosine ligase like 6 n=5 Tax=Rousettus aegyptiacus TaxID=9407 RepID=A0A7J8GJ62_ROUAE|nr:tubulin tyrosine ligase like 6 [Rousettus aegyptiacus]
MGACLNPSWRGPASMVARETGSGAGARLGSRNRGGGRYFPRVSSQSREMLQRLPLESEEGTESEERENSSVEDLKEIVALAFVKENTGAQKGLQNAQQQGKKRKKRR